MDLRNLSLIEIVHYYSKLIEDGRTRDDILIHTAEEFGELATECKIAKGRSYKEAGADGIVGESIDIILCALDMIFKDSPDITGDDIVDIAISKCEKWYRKVME